MGQVIGIDEAGRGSLAGPVVVAVLYMPEEFDWQNMFSLIARKGELPRLRDSKQLSAQQREKLFHHLVEHGMLRHAIGTTSARDVDEIGIVNAVNEALVAALHTLEKTLPAAKSAHLLLDAGLSAPSGRSQESFVRGDERIPAIACASIIAKVSRDALLEDLEEVYPGYDFAAHKGYGTLVHRKAIERLGFSPEHRRSFCRNLQPAKNKV
jgi:ribonuclease HII